MPSFSFVLFVQSEPFSDDEILDLADALGDAGCTDANICGHRDGIEIHFDREAQSLQSALKQSVEQVEQSGLIIARIEVDKETVVS